MIVTTLAIGDRRLRLMPDVNISGLEDELLDAMRAGGGVVTIPTAGRTTIRALITPGLPVLLESSEEHEADIPHFEDDISYEGYLSDYPLDF